MTDSQTLAIAAHLHVLLRRKTGRVTDTEWMASNLDYALEIIRFARNRAAQDGHPELQDWADKLQKALQDRSAPRLPLVHGAMQVLKQGNGAAAVDAAHQRAEPHGDSGFADSLLEPGSPPKPRDPNAPRYVGGIR